MSSSASGAGDAATAWNSATTARRPDASIVEIFEENRYESLGFVGSDGSGYMLRAGVDENGKGISQTRQQPILIHRPGVLQRSVINATGYSRESDDILLTVLQSGP